MFRIKLYPLASELTADTIYLSELEISSEADSDLFTLTTLQILKQNKI